MAYDIDAQEGLSMGLWHYNIEGVKQAPVPDDQLKVLAKKGVVRPIDFVKKEGTQEWVRARRIKGLFTIEEIYGFRTDQNKQEVEALPLSKLPNRKSYVLVGLLISGMVLIGALFYALMSV